MVRTRRWLLASAVLALLLVLVAWWVTRPQRVASLVMSQIGSALGLEITAGGTSEYTLFGGPRMVLRDVVAKAPGAQRPVLRAERIDVSVEWSTVRSRGAQLAFTRVELDAPQIDVPMLQAWLASRPPSEQQTPTFTKGLRVRDGRVLGAGWSIDGLRLDVPRVQHDEAVNVRVAGRYLSGATRVPFDLSIAMNKPASDVGLAVRGTATFEQDATRIPATLRASGRLQVGDEIRVTPLRANAAARYKQGDTDLPFAFAINGPLRISGGAVALSPAGFAVRGDGPVPQLDAIAAFAYTDEAALHVDGEIEQWPEAWPALPPPIGQSTSPLPLVLDYAGPFDFSDVARLQLRRDDTRFDGRFRLPDMLAWIDAANGSPLPPLSGRVTTPTLDISGAILEGVDVRLHEPSLDAAP